MTSLSDCTDQRPGRSKSATPVQQGMEYAASVAVLKETVQQLSGSTIAVLKEVGQ